MKSILLGFAICLVTSCSSVKYIKFTDQQNEIYPSNNLKSFLQVNKNPKVVLRIPRGKSEVTETEDRSNLYDAIEKELLKQGFTVRDRQLFNQVVSNSENNTDYSKLTEKTDTDLIIELSKLDIKVLYSTNKFATAKGKDGVLDYTYKRYGAVVEFKIVMMKNNEFAGTYTFHYAPCNTQNPCVIDDNFTKRWKRIQRSKEGFEGVETNELEKFIRDATKQLVESMRT